MTFANKIRKDKKFRMNAILVFIAIVFLIGNLPGEQKKEAPSQSVCNQANSVPIFASSCDFAPQFESELGGDICMTKNIITQEPSGEDIVLCVGLGCSVGRQLEDTFLINTPDSYACFDCVPSGLVAHNTNNCCSLNSVSSGIVDYPVLCKSAGQIDNGTGQEDPNLPNPKAACGSSIESLVADIGSSIPWVQDQPCKSRFYIMAFGGGLLALVLVLAAL
jgi:hypothetical protein